MFAIARRGDETALPHTRIIVPCRVLPWVAVHPALARIRTRLPGRERQNAFRHFSDACFIPGPPAGHVVAARMGGRRLLTGAVAASIVLGSVSCRRGLMAELSFHHTILRRRLLRLGFLYPFYPFVWSGARDASCPRSFSLVEPRVLEKIVCAIRWDRKSPRLRAVPVPRSQSWLCERSANVVSACGWVDALDLCVKGTALVGALRAGLGKRWDKSQDWFLTELTYFMAKIIQVL